MTDSVDKAHAHLSTAKEEVKSAAAVLVDEAKTGIVEKVDAAKDKVKEVVAHVADAITDKVDEVKTETPVTPAAK